MSITTSIIEGIDETKPYHTWCSNEELAREIRELKALVKLLLLRDS